MCRSARRSEDRAPASACGSSKTSRASGSCRLAPLSELVSRALDRLSQREEAKKIVEILSRRETEIVKMVATGLRNKEIATKLSIGEGTVKTHLHTIYEKLGVHGRVELTMYALERGII